VLAARQLPVVVSAVFQIDQPEYDNDCVTVPLDALRRLLEYRAGEASAIDIGLEPGADAARVASDIGAMLGDGFDVLSRERQQADTFRMISVEKWITFLMLVFILVVASFNIVSTLSLMVIEKRYDMATLRSLGASRSTVRRVFIAEGWLITAVGGLVGIALGVGLSLLQEARRRPGGTVGGGLPSAPRMGRCGHGACHRRGGGLRHSAVIPFIYP